MLRMVPLLPHTLLVSWCSPVTGREQTTCDMLTRSPFRMYKFPVTHVKSVVSKVLLATPLLGQLIKFDSANPQISFPSFGVQRLLLRMNTGSG
uniref:Putative secreted protein n=1 Tax=Anopheles darlingi TaxID=43151 RepID=A0A2M4DCD0_ANODA